MNNFKALKRKNYVSVSFSIPLSLLKTVDDRAQSEQKSVLTVVTNVLSKAFRAFRYSPNVSVESKIAAPKPLNAIDNV